MKKSMLAMSVAAAIGGLGFAGSALAIGTVLAIENFGATDIIEITRAPVPEKGPKTFMVPMIPAAVLEWDEQRLVIAAGFAED